MSVSASARVRLRVRSAVSIVLGIAAGAAVAPSLGIAAGLLAGWGVVALVNVVWVLLTVWSMGPAETRAHATAEDPGRSAARVIAVVSSVASLIAVAVVAAQAQRADGITAYLLAGIALLSVASSWALIHTNYMLRYADLYYRSGEDGEALGGIDFNQAEPPQYTDFAYFSVGLGMTYQVADTDVSRSDVRRVVIAQTLLGYLFGVGIIANVVNLISGLG
ncbi:DUF1345 domain-containing protein [Leucobacter tenebrionis]|uniref:DUF1345 domain-containing protein n=1 Tax=Leucobacter tenebrionis TaxID=2873270 RepID=UPI001CA7B11D|nr:DUF1345 domain-containing protein [Leucobacter tenebrionis]QZY52306.1 DUF1345 domain-containing protein [Leucobacter tenebrionis]